VDQRLAHLLSELFKRIPELGRSFMSLYLKTPFSSLAISTTVFL
jgi:hypothetical protein